LLLSDSRHQQRALTAGGLDAASKLGQLWENIEEPASCICWGKHDRQCCQSSGNSSTAQPTAQHQGTTHKAGTAPRTTKSSSTTLATQMSKLGHCDAGKILRFCGTLFPLSSLFQQLLNSKGDRGCERPVLSSC